MPGGIRSGDRRPGGIIRYPSERLREEVAYLAYHFNWSYREIMTMDHRERQRWVTEVARINRRLNEEH
ncbi:MAG TPA: DUF6760 family protein [Methylococcaceae bacterium]|nr:DUF6760 family protein [Methylococcaceae bacterium]